MSNVWFTSDLHLGHKNIHKFRDYVDDVHHNTALISADWFSNVTKRDIVWVLGDIAFDDQGFNDFLGLPGEKRLVLGNHDNYPISRYARNFKHVYGFYKRHNAWLSHCPIHPDELRGRFNLHGHVHTSTLKDDRYFNCCVENCRKITGRSLINLEELRNLGYKI